MKRLSIVSGALSGALLTASLSGVMYLADKLAGLPFAPFDLFDWLTRVLPGPVITFGIDLMIDTIRFVGLSVADSAKTAERATAVLQFLGIGIVAGASFFMFFRLRGVRPGLSAGLIVGALVGLPMIAVSIAISDSSAQPILIVLWELALFVAWGVALRESYIRLIPELAFRESREGQTGVGRLIDRRQFLVRLGAATATITIASSTLGNMLAQAARRELKAEFDASMSHLGEGNVRPLFPNADDPLMLAPGTRPEYTPLKDHYKVFIRTEATVIEGANWSLPIVGLVENPVSLTIEDLRNNYESRDQYVTLSCISGRLGTTLISTTQWTGVSLQDLLADTKPSGNARYLHITSGDGFYETVSLDLIASDSRIMLCYAWDGNPLPIDHGFPLRIWIPDRYGMKQPKWITGIEVTEELRTGYWVERGWDAIAQVKAVSVVDTVAADAVYEKSGQQLVPIGGIAFAGARGISKVEVRVDGGPWKEAHLRAPLSETTWVIWRYDWEFASGDHEVEVRCAERDGTPQIEESQDNRPRGATGIHSRTTGF